jgi:hypothetical protein
MALNNRNETYYHHLQHNSHLKAHIILVTKFEMRIYRDINYFTCASSRISISSHENPSGNLYGSCFNSSIGLFSSTGPLFSEVTFVPILGTGCVCQNFHSCLEAASSSDFGALRLLLPALACSAKAICFNKFCTESIDRAY